MTFSSLVILGIISAFYNIAYCKEEAQLNQPMVDLETHHKLSVRLAFGQHFIRLVPISDNLHQESQSLLQERYHPRIIGGSGCVIFGEGKRRCQLM